jgi:hypothetical protein
MQQYKLKDRQMSVLFAQFSGQQQFLGSTPIPGLTLTLPEGAEESALVTLNVPASYAVIASFTSGRGGQFNISVDGTTFPPMRNTITSCR